MSLFWRLIVVVFFVCASSTAHTQDCPSVLKNADRLVLVTGATMNSSKGMLRLYERDDKGRWAVQGKARAISLGARGMGWGWDYSRYRQGRELVKQEGDKRTPAGFYDLGAGFGFSGKNSGSYLRLEHRKHICVDDPKSAYYNQIKPRSLVGEKVSGEKMRSIKLYRHGMIVNFPVNREKRGGSCIFLHVWRRPGAVTAGCVAMSAGNMLAVQKWAGRSKTAIGIIPLSVAGRFAKCLMGIDIAVVR